MKAYYNTNGDVTLAHDSITLDLPFITIETCNFIKPKVVKGKLVEGATAEEIAEHNKPIVPQIVTNAQLRQALIQSDISIANITNFINAIEDVKQKETFQSLWEYANTFERFNPLLIQMSALLGITEAQMDQLFILANTK
jgi:hypothetical protein